MTQTQPQSAQTMRLGDRLIDAGFITQQQSDAAAAYHAEHGGLFGDALIRLGILTEARLDEFFSRGNNVWSGERMVQAGIINRSQLIQARSYQEEHGGRLGNAIVALGFAVQSQIDDFFKNDTNNQRPRMGEMLVSNKIITQEQLDRALAFQRSSGGQLGEILISLRMVEPSRLYRILASQQGVGRVGTRLDFTDARRIPYRVALQYNAIIVNTRPDAYVLAVHTILNEEQLKVIGGYLDKPVEQVLGTIEEIENFWELVYQYNESEDSIYKLYNEQPQNSAIVTLSRGQKIVGALALIGIILSFIFDYYSTLTVINLVLQITYGVVTLLKLFILYRGFSRRDHLKYTPEQVAALDERDLPIYTLLIPIYKEASIAELLVERINNIDYPPHKLDVRILLEEDDPDTYEALRALDLPSHITLIVVPDTKPRTKPKACNYGLIRARGEYVVIYDAEDIPERDQLKKAVLAFRELPEEYVCIQSKLNYFNSKQNILTQWFTQEYSCWFDILLIGIMTIDTPIPLGGTSNHFKTSFLREIGAWDPFNVTEDADLGVRLYKMHYHTAVLDSHTWEEANSVVGNWIRQRSRWIKGYMQTWLVHMRSPIKLMRDLGGLKGFIGYQMMVLGTPLVPLLNPIFWAMMIIWIVFEPGIIASLFPGWLYYMALFLFLGGNFLFIYTNIIGAYTVIRESEESGNMHISYSIIFSGVFLLFYWVLMSVAAYKALYQLIKNPFYWEKTQHGLTKQTKLESMNG